MSVLFITDNDCPNTTAIVSSLGKKGIKVYISPGLSVPLSVLSRYIVTGSMHRETGYSVFGQESSQDQFIAELVEMIRKWKIKVLVPLSSPALIPIVKNKTKIQRETGVKIPIPDYDIVIRLHDKRLSLELAKQYDIPHPRSYVPKDLSEVEEISYREEYPLVIKPNIGRGGEGIKIAFTREELLSKFKEVLLYSRFPLIQEYIPGEKKTETNEYIVLLFLDMHHSTKAIFCLKRIRAYPVTYTDYPISCFTSFAINESREDIINYAIRILQGVKWYGATSVQFKIDRRDNTPKFMEANPRLAGITPFATQCNVNFPLLLYKLAMGEDIDNVSPLNGTLKYSVLHKDIIVGIRDYFQTKEKYTYIRNFLRSYKRNVYFVDFDLKDPLPYLLFFIRRFFEKIIFGIVSSLSSIYKKITKAYH